MKLIVSLTIILAAVISALFLRVSYLEQQGEEAEIVTYNDDGSNRRKSVDIDSITEPQVAGERFIPTQDLDPYVNCAIHEKCGGGTRYVRKSVCDTNMYCCFLNDGTSKLMTKYECDNYYANNPQNVKPSNTYDTSYNYVPNYSYPPCTLYSAVLGYSTTYYVDTETCNKWKADQEKSNQDYLNWKANSGNSSTGLISSYGQEQWLEDCKKMADEIVAMGESYGMNWEQAYNGCSGNSTGTLKIGEPESTKKPNYEGTDVRY